MTRLVNRSPLEQDVTPTGTPLKSFWGCFKVPTSNTAQKTYRNEVESFGEMEDPEGRVDVTNATDVSSFSAELRKASTVIRTIATDRKIVYINDAVERKFLDCSFQFSHDSVDAKTIFELFSDADLLKVSLSSNAGSINLFGYEYTVDNYESIFMDSMVGPYVSKMIRLEMFSKNLEFPVVGTRVSYKLRVKLSTSEGEFQTSVNALTLHDKRWQAELRMESET